MSGHTPGPWLTERNQQGGIAVVGVNDLTGINEINVANAWYESDARLIAAAPDLLAALLAIRAVAGQHHDAPYGDWRVVDDCARLAIDKATQP